MKPFFWGASCAECGKVRRVAEGKMGETAPPVSSAPWTTCGNCGHRVDLRYPVWPYDAKTEEILSDEDLRQRFSE